MTPQTPTGFVVGSFAARLINPRSLYVLPNGDVLTAEATGRHGTAGQITLLRDADGNRIAETRTVFLSGLPQPFGMLLLGDPFYVAAAEQKIVVLGKRVSILVKSGGSRVIYQKKQ